MIMMMSLFKGHDSINLNAQCTDFFDFFDFIDFLLLFFYILF